MMTTISKTNSARVLVGTKTRKSRIIQGKPPHYIPTMLRGEGPRGLVVACGAAAKPQLCVAGGSPAGTSHPYCRSAHSGSFRVVRPPYARSQNQGFCPSSVDPAPALGTADQRSKFRSKPNRLHRPYA